MKKFLFALLMLCSIAVGVLLHADETETQVLHEPGKAPQSKSYMWLYRTGSDVEHPIELSNNRVERSIWHKAI